MTVEDIISGESGYIEFKQEVPKKSEVYMKTVVAFANGSGGKIVFGVEDSTFEVVGINQEDAFSIMDGITSAICDSCTPMITPIVTLASVEEKVVIVVNIMPGGQRPYYLTTKEKENGTYIRVSGTTRPADSFVLNECYGTLGKRNSEDYQTVRRIWVRGTRVDGNCWKFSHQLISVFG